MLHIAPTYSQKQNDLKTDDYDSKCENSIILFGQLRWLLACSSWHRQVPREVKRIVALTKRCVCIMKRDKQIGERFTGVKKNQKIDF
jgi:hypothetical protein